MNNEVKGKDTVLYETFRGTGKKNCCETDAVAFLYLASRFLILCKRAFYSLEASLVCIRATKCKPDGFLYKARRRFCDFIRMSGGICPDGVSHHLRLGYGRLNARFLFDDSHLVNQVLAAAQLVEYKEHVADVESNAALQVIVEVDVAAQRFPVAVESTADEVALTVDDGATGVTACDVVSGQEADGHGTIGHGVASEVFLLNQLLQLGGYYEFRIFGVFFL